MDSYKRCSNSGDRNYNYNCKNTKVCTIVMALSAIILIIEALLTPLQLNTVYSTSTMGKVTSIEYSSKRGYARYRVRLEGIDEEIEPQIVTCKDGITEPYMLKVTQVLNEDFTWLRNTYTELVIDSKYNSLDQVTIYP